MDRRIEWALAQMEQRLSEPLTVATLAAEVNLSASRFAHLFQEQTGASPGRYLQALRMSRGRLLLERTFLSVKEVMVLVGCNDPSHFSRDFKRLHGVSPSECRAAAGACALHARALDALESRTVARVAALANAPMNAPTETSASSQHPALPVHQHARERRGITTGATKHTTEKE